MQRGYWCLFVIMSTLQLVSAEEYFAVRNVQGIVGKSVHMCCVLEKKNSTERVYFQKRLRNGTEIFINGFYSSKLKVHPEYVNRTVVNKTELSMELLHLSLDDEGKYTCIPFFGVMPQNATKFNLKVIANYHVPNITVQGCGLDVAGRNCLISCSSSGGFPRSNVTWHGTGGEINSLLMYEELLLMQDKRSQLWNVSQAVRLNCSRPLSIACSVGGAVSPAVSVCPPSQETPNLTPVAVAVLLLVSFIVVMIGVLRCRRPGTRRPAAERSTDAELASLNSDQAG